jgi:hypothetical protein
MSSRYQSRIYRQIIVIELKVKNVMVQKFITPLKCKYSSNVAKSALENSIFSIGYTSINRSGCSRDHQSHGLTAAAG